MVTRPLQAVLDRADLPGRTVRRRRIEVDLGRVRPADFTAAFVSQRIAASVGRQLVDMWPVSSEVIAPAPDVAEQLTEFLRGGTLPWTAPGTALTALYAPLLALDDGRIFELAERLRPLLAIERLAERFVRQLPAVLVIRIARALAHAKSLRRSQSEGFIADGEARLWARTIARAARERDAVRQLNELLATASKALDDGSSLKAEPPRIDARESPEPSPEAQQPMAEEAAEVADADLPDRLPVAIAGMILLHPFLDGLCRAAELLDANGAFTGPQSQQRAVLLLHFVATGREEVAEPDLVLPKLLCGMPLDGLVPRQIVPTETERFEAEALLGAAIAHWGALGDSSPAALRETFLERPGQLRRDGDDWRLTVEPRGVDMLLDRLPWTIGIVKTPFMARPLRVEWR